MRRSDDGTAELIVLWGGPRHRFVYTEADWLAELERARQGRQAWPPYEDTGRYRRLGDIYTRFADSATAKRLEDRAVRGWQYVDKPSTQRVGFPT